MKKTINTANIIKEVNTSQFLLNCKLPLGYVNGYPIIQIRNDRLCMLIPYLKFKTTGEVDKTLVYPIRYTATLSLPDKKFIGFEDLAFNPAFRKIDFNKAIGFFRHDSIKQYSKPEYREKRAELLSMYDKAEGAILYGEEYTDDDFESFRELLNIMLEPSLKPIYKALDADFYNTYFE
ncbi:MAG: hypothetical protein ACI4I4_04210 [Acutalibacteraceae bacterium]